MSYNTHKLYDAEYCKRINNKSWRFNVTPKTVKIIYDFFTPRSVVDVGCANGIHLKAFSELGVKTFGIEGTRHWKPYIEENYKGEYKILDLRKPLPDLGKFDLVMCMEVLEHLEEEFADQAVKNLSSLGNTIICSACPIIGGFHHLNPQPKDYWIEKFEAIGYVYDYGSVNYLQDKFSKINCSGWYKTGLKIFEKIN